VASRLPFLSKVPPCFLLERTVCRARSQNATDTPRRSCSGARLEFGGYNMKALILAAGPGSRLLPLTLERPKCLVTIAGHAILDYQIAALVDAGIHEIGIVVGYLPELIKSHVADVKSRITFIENPDYASTSSSYSLWLARDFIRDGFIHLNSDLVFDPRLLRTLLKSPDSNAVIVDRRIDVGSDMMKARMDDRRILEMSKRLEPRLAAAEVVGPAKFDAAGARRIAAYLDEQISRGQRNRWAYDVFGSLAGELDFCGVDHPGCFWAEVDTSQDARRAADLIPESLVEFVGARLKVPA
jgi:L-glutamine-phosphate cytidylyltransferase